MSSDLRLGVAREMLLQFIRMKARLGSAFDAWIKRPRLKRNKRKRAQKEARRKRGLL
jgi:hypothetical protein